MLLHLHSAPPCHLVSRSPNRWRRPVICAASNAGGSENWIMVVVRRMICKTNLIKSREESPNANRFARKVIVGLIAVPAAVYAARGAQASLLRRFCSGALGLPVASLSIIISNHKRDILANLRWSITHLSYLFDVVLERHPETYLLMLGTACIVLVFVGGLAFYNLRTPQQPLGEAFWEAWSCVCNSSMHLKQRTAAERGTGILLAIGGLMFYSLLTSTLTAQFKSRMEVLREGALVEVMEVGHTVICGTNSHLATLLKQLDKSQSLALKIKTAASRKQTVVLLSEESKDNVSREGDLQFTTKECKALNLLIRSGRLSDPETFQNVGANRASRVIFLTRKTDAYEADADVVLSILALQSLREQKPVQLIAEVSKEGTAQLLKSLVGANATAVQDLSSKLLVQCSRQHGLIDVYIKLLDHGGQTINIFNYPSLSGLCYRDIRRGFKEGIACGIIRDNSINFHPKDGLTLKSSDKLIVICQKNKHQKLSKSFFMPTSTPSSNTASVVRRLRKPLSKTEWSTPRKEYIVILGWRPSVKEMVAEYDCYVGHGSELMIIADEPLKRRQLPLTQPLKNIKVLQTVGNPLNEVDLKNAISEIRACKANAEGAVSIVVIIDEKCQQSISKSDKQSIYALLLAESVCKQLNLQVSSLVAELVDSRLGNQVVKSHDTLTFIGTSELMGFVTAQVAENMELNGIWTELLNSWGNEIYVKDISLYTKLGEETPSFQELSDRAVVRDEVAIGYRINNKIVVNPASKTDPLTFSPGDSLVVICEFEYGNYQET